MWRYRVGDHRVICQLEDDQLLLLVLPVSVYLSIVKTSLGGAAVVKAQLPVDQAQRSDGITLTNGWNLPSEPGSALPGAHETRRSLTNCSTAGAWACMRTEISGGAQG